MSARGLSRIAREVWEELPDEAKEDLVMSLLDTLRGKPPRVVRLAKLQAETIKAKAEVRARFR
jgi:hypothetical protein